ncbi:MAG TPA: DNA mismatch repair protein [Thermoanaerobaculia bacterium]|nr:DNA mismatch repair protein [Thermoanaerobaculia bacterium]
MTDSPAPPLTGTTPPVATGDRPSAAAVEETVIPDLLHRDPQLVVDEKALQDLLGLAFLGRDLGTSIGDALAAAKLRNGAWKPEFFEQDLFVRDFAKACATLAIGDSTYPANDRFLRKVLTSVPVDLETVSMRQGILRELTEDPAMRGRFEELYRSIFALTTLFGTPGSYGRFDTASLHLEILQQAKLVIDRMADGFTQARSALRRLHDAGSALRESGGYGALRDLLEYEHGMADLDLRVRLGGDGRIRRVAIERIAEDRGNRFWTPPWRRLRDRLRVIASGYDFSRRELMDRLVNQVFADISPSLVALIQLLGHLELYLTNLRFKADAEARGLAVCLAELDQNASIELERLFNPLLLLQNQSPVPCDIRNDAADAIVLVTGPNSGGKTRLLQALGWAALLGQSGLYAPAARARMPPRSGLFVSLVENETAAQTEGRLGRELVRIRTLFEEMRPGSMVVLDELCSGTNPSEGIEVFAMVLRLLRHVHPTAFVTTHFLDFARSLVEHPPIDGLEFLQVELDAEQSSTYQFVPGVAPTSLAALTAARLGVTFDRLSALIAGNGDGTLRESQRPHAGEAAEPAPAKPSSPTDS